MGIVNGAIAYEVDQFEFQAISAKMENRMRNAPTMRKIHIIILVLNSRI
jgi:hypothetical protein